MFLTYPLLSFLQVDDEESNTSTEDALSKSSSSAALYAEFSTQPSPTSVAGFSGANASKSDWSPQSFNAGERLAGPIVQMGLGFSEAVDHVRRSVCIEITENQ